MGIIKIDKDELNKLIKKAKDKTSDVIGENNLKKIIKIKDIAIETGNSIKDVINSEDENTEDVESNNNNKEVIDSRDENTDDIKVNNIVEEIINIEDEDTEDLEFKNTNKKEPFENNDIKESSIENAEQTSGIEFIEENRTESSAPQNNEQLFLKNINQHNFQKSESLKEAKEQKVKNKKVTRKINKKVIAIIAIIFALTAIAIGIVRYIQEINKSNKVIMSHSSETYYGNMYSYVVSNLRKDGVKNIELVEITDLSTKSILNEGCVEKVYINGKDSFEQNEEFPLNSIVKIYYHTTHKIKSPYSSAYIQDKDVDSLLNDYLQAGFINVSTSDKYDLDPDEFDGEYQIGIIIDNEHEFDANDEFFYNEIVSIVKHYPYSKFDVNVNINFTSNLFFSKYGINVYIDSECLKKLEHGEDASLELRLKEGKNTIRFVSDDDKSDYKEMEIDVIDDMDVTYTLSTSSTFGLSATEDNITYKTYLREGEIRMSEDISTYIGKNYNDVVDSIKLLGFTNITTTPKYDLDDSSSERENVINVIFGENKTYSVGDVLQNDTAIEIIYHLTESDKPESMRIQEAKDSLPLYIAQRAFQNMGDYTYPYGFKCHWVLKNYEEEQYDDGSWFLKVGVTITNAFGAKVEATAEAYIDNTNSMVRDFTVYDVH